MTDKCVILGVGGFAKEVYYLVKENNYDLLGFLVDPQYIHNNLIIDLPILGDFSWIEKYKKDVKVVCAVGDPIVRKNIVERVLKTGAVFVNIIHPTVKMYKTFSLGTGNIITQGTVITDNIKLGSYVIINLNCTIGHDSIIEDFVTISPGVNISGNVVLRRESFVGTGAVIIEKKEVGEKAIVGAGAVIIKDVEKNTTVVGNPGRVIKKKGK